MKEEIGIKLDNDKIKAAVLGDFSIALEAVAKVGTFGVNKYTRGGWKYVENAKERYSDAMWRHLLAININEIDEESGFKHIYHLAWNVLALIELEEKENV